MKMYLQMGYGMLGHAVHLLDEWDASGVILSPRDNTAEQMQRVANHANNRTAGGAQHEVLLDPQCYLHDADHHLLEEKGHDYWDVFKRRSTGDLLTPTGARDLMQRICTLNDVVGSSAVIVPGLLGEINTTWDALHQNFLEAATQLTGLPLIATIAMTADQMANEDRIEAVAEYVGDWPVAGFYLVAESPGGSYLIDNPSWLANAFTLTAHLKLASKRVIFGYANHQYLPLAATMVDAIASGTFLNVRSFGTTKFYEPEDAIRQRSTWFYCPHALSEYQLPYLDIAKRNGVLDGMRPQAPLSDSYCQLLFGSANPTDVNWREPQAFRHYLTSLYGQVATADVSSYGAAQAYGHALLDRGESEFRALDTRGVYSSQRGIGRGALDATRSALITLDNSLGVRLRREWTTA